ncbi:membrane protein [Bifidobacterium breve MCC 1128]|uniref:Membrane protein n=1 Tax=Bifidobacterium breve MCC 1128 TaxID=1365965 RepID=A0A0L7B0I4_BIFBR|nr:magnesium transporter [Bifidobacterium breve]KOA40944.1 membrane protein [Bifidobacterium breve MCC 1128]
MSPILDGMGYESLSTVVVLVTVIIAIAVWLPARTANGMKRAAEHRQDRYSPSLRIVEAEDGRRFGDIEPYQAKGAAMPASTQSARLTTEHIAHIRELRRESIRRRQILVASLLAVAIVVFALAFIVHYNPLFALIPLALTAAVLAMGANAARQARQWERRVSRYEQKKTSATPAQQGQIDSPAKNHAESAAPAVQTSRADDAATEVMEQRQIRRVLHDAEVEQAKAKALREAQAKADREAAAPQAADHSEAETPSLTVRDERDAHDSVADDATSELASVQPARALDVFDMATSQDLISFSLGADHAEDNAPESLEIKSTRQVSKATPAEPEMVNKLIDEAKAVKASDDASAAKAQADHSAAQPESFHEHEERTEVQAPVATSESLSVGLDSILARRGN